MRYKKTFKLFKEKAKAINFCKQLKNKKHIITETTSKDNSYNFVVWYFE